MSVSMRHRVDAAVGDRLRELRLAAGLSQGDIAAILAAPISQVELFEHGLARIGAGRLADLSQHLGVSVTAFFERIDPPVQQDSILAEGGDETPDSRDKRVSTLVRHVLERATLRICD